MRVGTGQGAQCVGWGGELGYDPTSRTPPPLTPFESCSNPLRSRSATETTPTGQVAVPAAVSSVDRDAAASAATTAKTPTPRFHVPSTGVSGDPARSQSTRNTGEGDHAARSISTHDPRGNPRARLAARPPPVTCERACTAGPTVSSASTCNSGAVYNRVGVRSSSPQLRPKSGGANAKQNTDLRLVGGGAG